MWFRFTIVCLPLNEALNSSDLILVQHQWRSLNFSSGGSKTYIPRNFYRTGGSKTYIPKNFYTKTTCTTLLSEKFGGSGAPPGPLNATPLFST
ncbi:hypothetical protein Hanom_Chr08g00758641 [Helianthus anomalus]